MHRLGFHGPNWYPFWNMGDIWIECIVCGARRFPPSEDMNVVPPEEIAPQSRFAQ
jgi:hypothetical protein